MNNRVIVLHEDQAREMIENAVSQAVATALEQFQKRAEERTPPEEYVTRQQAAALLSCHVGTIDKMRREKVLKPYRIFGAMRFKKSDVLNFSKT